MDRYYISSQPNRDDFGTIRSRLGSPKGTIRTCWGSVGAGPLTFHKRPWQLIWASGSCCLGSYIWGSALFKRMRTKQLGPSGIHVDCPLGEALLEHWNSEEKLLLVTNTRNFL